MIINGVIMKLNIIVGLVKKKKPKINIMILLITFMYTILARKSTKDEIIISKELNIFKR